VAAVAATFTFGRPSKIAESNGKLMKIYESENPFFSFLLLFGIGPFQRVTRDSNKKNSPVGPDAPLARPLPEFAYL